MRLRTLLILVALAVSAVCAQAQWLNHPAAGTPRTKDGKPNLSAPAPRASNGKPDLSGVWQAVPAPLEVRLKFFGGDGTQTSGEPPPSLYFMNALSDYKPDDIVLAPPAAALFKQRGDSISKDLPSTHCLPLGVPLMDAGPFPHKIVQSPDLVLILYEELTMFRQIYTDGRKLPVNPEPAFAGYSVGRWDGDSLVVETIGLRNDSWLDAFGHPLSDTARVTQRLRRRDFGTMDVQVTIDDGKYYSKPFTYTFTKRLFPDTDVLESVCENEKDRQHLK